jgi:hypothetical protein
VAASLSILERAKLAPLNWISCLLAARSFYNQRKDVQHMSHKNDIVLIYYEDQPLVFARIEDIAADKKKDWYQVKLLMLQVPLQTTTWILRDNYIRGQEFTMDGKKLRLERVLCPEEPDNLKKEHDTPVESKKEKIISFADIKKK